AGVGLVVLSAANEREREARTNEGVARLDAERKKEQLRYNLYVSTMNLVSREWDSGNVPHALALLGQCVPQQPGEKDLRGWEWYYYERLCHGELRVLKHGKAAVNSAAFSPDGTRLATASYDGKLRSWDAATGEPVWSVRADDLMAVAYSPDGRQLATGAEDGTVKLWDAVTGQALRTLPGHTDFVRCVSFHRDCKRLASGSLDGTVRLWDAATGQEVRALKGHVGAVYSVAFSPDGTRLAAAGRDGASLVGTMCIWDTETGKLLRVFKEGRADSAW